MKKRGEISGAIRQVEMRFITLFIIFILPFAICAQTDLQTLKKAYKQKSPEKLKAFFEGWHKDIPAISQHEFDALSDTAKEVYHIFTAFYKPTHLDSIGGSEWGKNIYDNVQFLLIQNSISYGFAKDIAATNEDKDKYILDYINSHIKDDSSRVALSKKDRFGKFSNIITSMVQFDGSTFPELKDSIVDTIKNFRPNIYCGDKVPIYLTPQYNFLLSNFLGDKYVCLGHGGLVSPAFAKGKSEKKKKFLEKYIKIWYGHWGGYWQLNSYPVITSLIFNPEMNSAKVRFDMIYEGGEAILVKENGAWRILYSQLTWIE